MEFFYLYKQFLIHLQPKENAENLDSEKSRLYSFCFMNIWLAGYNWSGNIDKSNDFFMQNKWFHGFEKLEEPRNKLLKGNLQKVKVGDIFILKSSYTRGPRKTNQSKPCTKIIAIGVVERVLSYYNFDINYWLKEETEFLNVSYRGTFEMLRKDNPNELELRDYINQKLMIFIKMNKNNTYINLLEKNKNLILTGAPGTGKTFLAKKIAKEIVKTTPINEIVKEDIEKFISLNQVVSSKENYKFTVIRIEKEVITNKPENAIHTYNVTYKDILDCFLEDRIDKKVEESNKNGTGSYIIGLSKYIKEKKQENQISFVQFHPSYDYTDFVEGLRPVQKGETLGFELKNGIFKDFCKKAKENPTGKYVFIIDEINRAEISKVFGELFFALDAGYRGEKGKVKTQYSNIQTEATAFTDVNDDYFYIPENVYIIGTMNDIDRSVESFDFAMRRRFAWCEIKASDRVDMWENAVWKDDAKIKMNALNAAIESEAKLSFAYHVGPAYFLKLNNYDNNFEELWQYHIEILLKEYLRGMPNETAILEKLKTAYNN